MIKFLSGNISTWRCAAAGLLVFLALCFAGVQASAQTFADQTSDLLRRHNLIKAAEADVAGARERARCARCLFPNMNLTSFYGHEEQLQPNADNTSLATREFDVTITQLPVGLWCCKLDDPCRWSGCRTSRGRSQRGAAKHPPARRHRLCEYSSFAGSPQVCRAFRSKHQTANGIRKCPRRAGCRPVDGRFAGETTISRRTGTSRARARRVALSKGSGLPVASGTSRARARRVRSLSSSLDVSETGTSRARARRVGYRRTSTPRYSELCRRPCQQKIDRSCQRACCRPILMRQLPSRSITISN